MHADSERSGPRQLLEFVDPADGHLLTAGKNWRRGDDLDAWLDRCQRGRLRERLPITSRVPASVYRGPKALLGEKEAQDAKTPEHLPEDNSTPSPSTFQRLSWG